MRRHAAKRTYIWSESISYCVGLIASDGCLQKDGRHIDLTSIDIEQLTNFSRAIGRDFYIGRKLSGSITPAYRIQFSDVAFYDFLLTTGLTPAKSMTISSLIIPDEYYADFLRGLFDGDGSCYSYIDKRWKSSYMYYVTFTSASLEFLYFIQQSNVKLANTSLGSIRKGTRAYSIAYAKRDAALLFNFMYHRQDVICLSRKYHKLRSFTTYGQNDIIQ